MSEVTTAALTCYYTEQAALGRINAYLKKAGYEKGLLEVGGTVNADAGVEMGVWVGAFNHLPTRDFFYEVQGAQWRYQDRVTLVLQFEEGRTVRYQFKNGHLRSI